MADAAEVRRVALSLEGVEEIDSDGFDFRVGGRGFVWSYPERVTGRPRVIRTASYDGLPLVMVRLDHVGVERLTDLVTDAWQMRREG